MEPNTTRYAIAPTPFGVRCQRPHSPSSVPTSAIAAPPAIIWIAAPTYGLVSVRCRLLYTEPSDHEALAHVSAIGPRRSACKISAGLAPTSRAVPRKPSSSPVTTRQFRSPEPPGMIASKNAIHSATVTTKMLAMPDAVYCSAQTTNALPPDSSSRPTIAWVRQSPSRLGSVSPSASAAASSTRPAMKNRRPANRNGGSTPTPTRIARWSSPRPGTRPDTRRAPCRAAPPRTSVRLHRDESRLLEHGAQHDRRPRAHLGLGRAAQIPQHTLQALEIGRRDLEDVPVRSGAVVPSEYFRMLLHVAHPRLVADIVGVGVAHGHEGRHGKAGLGPVHSRAVPGDVPRLLQPLHALHHGRPRQAHFVRDRLVAGPSVGGELPHDFAIHGIQLGLVCHFGAPMSSQPTRRRQSHVGDNVCKE